MNEGQGLIIDFRRIRDGVIRISLFTAGDGLITGLYRSSEKKNNSKFRPLSAVSYGFSKRQSSDLFWFQHLSIVNPHFNIHSDLVKQCIVLYLQELLVKSILPGNPNLALYRFLFDSIHLLDDSHRPANFPLWATLEIIRHQGYLPDVSQIELIVADNAGSLGHKTYSQEAKALIVEFMPLEWSQVSDYAVSSAIRREATDMLIQFFCKQLEIKSKFYSVEILQEVLHS